MAEDLQITEGSKEEKISVAHSSDKRDWLMAKTDLTANLVIFVLR